MNRKTLAPLSPLLLLLVTSTACAQTSGGTGKGLDSLDEQLVMSNLAGSNLETLLDRDFHNFNVPANQQDTVKVGLKLQDLLSYTGNIAGRRALALQVARGMDAQLPKATDPDLLLKQANQLSSAGIAPVVTALEYFGENPVAQAELKPAAEVAKKMYQQVAVLADKKSELLAKGIKKNEDYVRIAPQLRKMGDVKTFGTFSDNMTTYSLCIALPRTDPNRKKLAEESITYLTKYDDAQSGMQADIKVQVGKLQLIEGDFAKAKATLDLVVDGKGLTPAPSTTAQNTARYFGIVAMISARQLPAADKEIPLLEKWEAVNYLPTLPNKSDQDAVKASLSMLKFRLLSAQSDLANNVQEKQDKNDKAITVLAELLKDQPILKDLVFDQLLGRIPEKPDYTSLNPLVLQALQQQGFAEVVKPEDAVVDQKKLSRAIDAARELVTRVGQPGVDATVAGLSSYFIAYAYDRMKDGKNAAAAFMDFAEKYPNDKDKAGDAIDHAGKWVLELRNKDETDQDVRKLYDRFLPLAINPPYNRKQWAFRYAALLLGESKFKEAASFFSQVPPTAKNFDDAQYYQLLALYKEMKDPALTGDARTAVVNQILDLAKKIDGMLAAATPANQAKYVEWAINGDLISADLTRVELTQPDKALDILNGFENRIAASSKASEAHLDAMKTRVSCYLDQKKADEAVKTLLSLMQTDAAAGQRLMLDVLTAVENDENNATDPNVRKNLAIAKATLSGFVLDDAMKSKEPALKAAVPTFQLYDATAKREAAEMNDDPAAKKASLEAALKGYQTLYDQMKNDTSPTSKADAALLGVGLTQYDLQNYQAAIDALAPLIGGKKVGEPMIKVQHGGIEEDQENPQYWETFYKEMKSIVEVCKKNPKDPKSQDLLQKAQSHLGALATVNGKHFGGKTYKEDFQKLRAELATLTPAPAKPAK